MKDSRFGKEDVTSRAGLSQKAGNNMQFNHSIIGLNRLLNKSWHWYTEVIQPED